MKYPLFLKFILLVFGSTIIYILCATLSIENELEMHHHIISYKRLLVANRLIKLNVKIGNIGHDTKQYVQEQQIIQ